MSKLTVLSYGGGQDSHAMQRLLQNNSALRQMYAPHDFISVMSDTGDEHRETYSHIQSVQRHCQQIGHEFYFLTPDMGFHTQAWQSLEGHFRQYNNVMTKRFKKSCTDGLKIQPIYKFLNRYVSRLYGYPESGGKYGGKSALVQFAQEHGKIRVLIGFTVDEQDRIATDKEISSKWMRLAIERAYPLVWMGWDRHKCQEYIASLGEKVPPPSNCEMCPFMTKIELLWLYRNRRAKFNKWASYERNKLTKFAHLGKSNVGVFGSQKTLLEVVKEAEKQYGHMTDEEIAAYKFSHGHCVKSRY